MTSRWPVLIALSCVPLVSAAQERPAEVPAAGMVITGDREAPLVLYIVPWQEPKPVQAPQPPLQPLLPAAVDRPDGGVLDDPRNRAPGTAAPESR